MGSGWRRGFFGIAALLAAWPGQARAADPVLAPTGHLRAAYIVSNLAQARRDPVSGAITGVIVDIANDLARHAEIPVTILPVATAADVIESVRSGAADIGFVALNPERAGRVLYSQPYMLVQQSAFVRADSSLRSVRELDEAGRVVGANTDDSVGVWLKGKLEKAQLRASPDYTLREAINWVMDGSVAAFAGGRQRLASGIRDDAGVRLLDDDFYGVPQTVAVPPGDEARLAKVNVRLDEMRASSLLADSIRRSGIVGLSVAPAVARP